MTNTNIVPLVEPIRDIYNAEHDVLIGPCACGGWHHDESDYFYKLTSRDQAWVMEQKGKATTREKGKTV